MRFAILRNNKTGRWEKATEPKDILEDTKQYYSVIYFEHDPKHDINYNLDWPREVWFEDGKRKQKKMKLWSI